MKQIPYYPNIILIAGAGRNVGKTTFACNIIEYLSERLDVTGLKISPHMHEVDEQSEILFKNENIYISKENGTSKKDSSKMLRAGAKQVFYVQSQQGFLEVAFKQLLPFIAQSPVVCESGGLHQILKPALFFFMHCEGRIPENKKVYLKYEPILTDMFAETGKFNIKSIRFKEGEFSIFL